MAADPPAKLPVAKDLTQVLNRISLGLAKHERILKTLNRPSPSSTTKSSSSGPSGFSSLTSSSAPTPVPVQTYALPSRQEEEALFAAERNLAPNAGIGFAPVKKEDGVGRGTGGAKEEKMLRGRILGKNARAQMEDKEKRKYGKRRYESESEEEEGRSGLGKKKTMVVKRVVGDVKDEPEVVVKEEVKQEVKEKIKAEDVIKEEAGKYQTATPEVKTEDPETTATPVETISKNKKNKMRKKAAKKAAGTQDTEMADAPVTGDAGVDGKQMDVPVTQEGKDADAGEKEKKKIRRKRGKKGKDAEAGEDGDVVMEE